MKPDYVSDLESVFGAASTNAWGSAVFFDHVASSSDLDAKALQVYRTFVGDVWERFGEQAWMSGWRHVHSRSGGGDIVGELEQSKDRELVNAVSILFHSGGQNETRASAIKSAFDDPDVAELRTYTTGDGDQMSGLLIIARRANGDTVALIFLLD